MIMHGNTPRSLTWPGCLAVITLGLTCLPMLPSLHGQTPGKEDARKSVEDAEKALREAKEVLKEHEANLKQKMKQLIRAEQELATESVRKGLLQIERLPGNYVIAEAIGEGKATHLIIEITLPTGESVKADDLVEKIRKVLPEKVQCKIVLRSVREPHRIVIAPGMQTTPTPPHYGRTAGPLSKPAPSEAPSAKSQSKSSEKRINDLEKKLEKVLEELQEMRKQMKRQRGGTGEAPPRVRPGAGGYAPANAFPLSVPGQNWSAPATPLAPPGTSAPASYPNLPTRPAANPPSAPATPDPNPDPSVRRVPNPYRDRQYRSMC